MSNGGGFWKPNDAAVVYTDLKPYLPPNTSLILHYVDKRAPGNKRFSHTRMEVPIVRLLRVLKMQVKGSMQLIGNKL